MNTVLLTHVYALTLCPVPCGVAPAGSDLCAPSDLELRLVCKVVDTPGSWTSNLFHFLNRRKSTEICASQRQRRHTFVDMQEQLDDPIEVEFPGPFGSPLQLVPQYDHAIMIAGGSGIVGYISQLREIHRHFLLPVAPAAHRPTQPQTAANPLREWVARKLLGNRWAAMHLAICLFALPGILFYFSWEHLNVWKRLPGGLHTLDALIMLWLTLALLEACSCIFALSRLKSSAWAVRPGLFWSLSDLCIVLVAFILNASYLARDPQRLYPSRGDEEPFSRARKKVSQSPGPARRRPDGRHQAQALVPTAWTAKNLAEITWMAEELIEIQELSDRTHGRIKVQVHLTRGKQREQHLQQLFLDSALWPLSTPQQGSSQTPEGSPSQSAGHFPMKPQPLSSLSSVSSFLPFHNATFPFKVATAGQRRRCFPCRADFEAEIMRHQEEITHAMDPGTYVTTGVFFTGSARLETTIRRAVAHASTSHYHRLRVHSDNDSLSALCHCMCCVKQKHQPEDKDDSPNKSGKDISINGLSHSRMRGNSSVLHSHLTANLHTGKPWERVVKSQPNTNTSPKLTGQEERLTTREAAALQEFGLELAGMVPVSDGSNHTNFVLPSRSQRTVRDGLSDSLICSDERTVRDGLSDSLICSDEDQSRRTTRAATTGHFLQVAVGPIAATTGHLLQVPGGPDNRGVFLEWRRRTTIRTNTQEEDSNTVLYQRTGRSRFTLFMRKTVRSK
eukprot:g4105.t1